MADSVYMGPDPWSTLSLEHGQLVQNQFQIVVSFLPSYLFCNSRLSYSHLFSEWIPMLSDNRHRVSSDFNVKDTMTGRRCASLP